MIIVMADDPKHLENAEKLEASVNSAGSHSLTLPSIPVLFNKADFRVIQEERISFIGHGGKTRFGSGSQAQEEAEGLTPSEFVSELLSKGFPGTVKAIDLMGCNIGLIKNNSSYVTEVSTILKMNPSTAHIKVYAFTAAAELYSRLIVSVSTQTGKVFVSGVKSENENAYREILDNLNNEKERLNNFEDRIKDLKNHINSTSLEERIKINVNAQLQNTLNAKSIVETSIQTLKHQKQVLRVELYSNNNFRQLLNDTPTFYITPVTPAIANSPSTLLAPSSHTSTASNQDKMEKKSESITPSSLSTQSNLLLDENPLAISAHKKRLSNVFDNIIKNAEINKSVPESEGVEKLKKSKVDLIPSELTHSENKGKEENPDSSKNIAGPSASQASSADTRRPNVSHSDLYSHYTQPTLLEIARTQRDNAISTLSTSSLSSSITEEDKPQSPEASNTDENTTESVQRGLKR
jgi:hypothetical protein